MNAEVQRRVADIIQLAREINEVMKDSGTEVEALRKERDELHNEVIHLRGSKAKEEDSE